MKRTGNLAINSEKPNKSIPGMIIYDVKSGLDIFSK